MSKSKPIIHAPSSCGGQFEQFYTDKNIPYLRCHKCQYEISDWVKWPEYAVYWQNPDKWTTKKDHIVCLLSYFIYLYNKHYKLDFIFSLNERGLFRGPEITHIRKLYTMLDNNPMRAKCYLEWIFSFKVQKKKKKITSLAFLTVADLINEFNHYAQKQSTICRDTAIPIKMLNWVSENTPEILSTVPLKDHGDLHLLLVHYGNGRIPKTDALQTFIAKLRSCNYIDEQFKIKSWSDI